MAPKTCATDTGEAYYLHVLFNLAHTAGSLAFVIHVPTFIRQGFLNRALLSDAAGGSSKGPNGQREGPATAEEGRGPHVSLAVRLKRRDGDRQFHIGERIPYVLVSGRGKLQVWLGRGTDVNVGSALMVRAMRAFTIERDFCGDEGAFQLTQNDPVTLSAEHRYTTSAHQTTEKLCS